MTQDELQILLQLLDKASKQYKNEQVKFKAGNLSAVIKSDIQNKNASHRS
jgi:hypothetical protein